MWKDRVPLVVVDSESEKWEFQYTTASNTDHMDVEGLPIKDMIADGVDLLKIDIEGGEKEVFSMDCAWLTRVRYMFLEIHPGCWKTVFHALDTIGYDCKLTGENVRFEMAKQETI